MMDQVLKSLPEDAVSGLSLDVILDVLGGLNVGSRVALEDGFKLIALRAVETMLLADHRLRQLAHYWDAEVGRADEIIRACIRDLLGVNPPDRLVNYLRNCVGSGMSRNGEAESVSADLAQQVIERAISDNPTDELRCHICGFHFRSDDMGQRRKDAVSLVGGKLALYIHPNRLADQLKVWQIPTGKGGVRKLTELSIDHVVPQSGFGWTSADNLAPMCTFCNTGKMIYRRSMEPLSVLVASALDLCPEGRRHTLGRQIATVALLLYSSTRCGRCGKGPSEVELTVSVQRERKAVRAIVPGPAEVVCYSCIDG